MNNLSDRVVSLSGKTETKKADTDSTFKLQKKTFAELFSGIQAALAKDGKKTPSAMEIMNERQIQNHNMPQVPAGPGGLSAALEDSSWSAWEGDPQIPSEMLVVLSRFFSSAALSVAQETENKTPRFSELMSEESSITGEILEYLVHRAPSESQPSATEKEDSIPGLKDDDTTSLYRLLSCLVFGAVEQNNGYLNNVIDEDFQNLQPPDNLPFEDRELLDAELEHLWAVFLDSVAGAIQSRSETVEPENAQNSDLTEAAGLESEKNHPFLTRLLKTEEFVDPEAEFNQELQTAFWRTVPHFGDRIEHQPVEDPQNKADAENPKVGSTIPLNTIMDEDFQNLQPPGELPFEDRELLDAELERLWAVFLNTVAGAIQSRSETVEPENDPQNSDLTGAAGLESETNDTFVTRLMKTEEIAEPEGANNQVLQSAEHRTAFRRMVPHIGDRIEHQPVEDLQNKADAENLKVSSTIPDENEVLPRNPAEITFPIQDKFEPAERDGGEESTDNSQKSLHQSDTSSLKEHTLIHPSGEGSQESRKEIQGSTRFGQDGTPAATTKEVLAVTRDEDFEDAEEIVFHPEPVSRENPQTMRFGYRPEMAHFKAAETEYKPEITNPDQLIKQIVTRVEKGSKGETMELWVEPESLGRVEMELSVREGAVQARLTAGNRTCGELIASHLEQLRHELNQRGFQVAELAVDIDNSKKRQSDSEKRRKMPFPFGNLQAVSGPSDTVEDRKGGGGLLVGQLDYFV